MASLLAYVFLEEFDSMNFDDTADKFASQRARLAIEMLDVFYQVGHVFK